MKNGLTFTTICLFLSTCSNAFAYHTDLIDPLSIVKYEHVQSAETKQESCELNEWSGGAIHYLGPCHSDEKLRRHQFKQTTVSYSKDFGATLHLKNGEEISLKVINVDSPASGKQKNPYAYVPTQIENLKENKILFKNQFHECYRWGLEKELSSKNGLKTGKLYQDCNTPGYEIEIVQDTTCTAVCTTRNSFNRPIETPVVGDGHSAQEILHELSEQCRDMESNYYFGRGKLSQFNCE